MFEVKFVPANTIVTAEAGESLLEVARRGNVLIDAPCNGQGTCGKCKLRIVDGSVETVKNYHLTETEIQQGIILACCSKVIENITLEVPSQALRSNEMKIETMAGEQDQVNIALLLKHTLEQGMRLAGNIRKDYMELAHPDLDNNISDWDRIKEHLKKTGGYREIVCGVNILRKIPELLRENNFKITITHQAGNSDQTTILNVEGGDTSGIFYGVAIDVGTTSVAALLVNLPDQKIVARASAGNAQIKYGADIINRIIYATKNGGLPELSRAIIQETINPLLRKMYRDAQIDKGSVNAFVAAGNTTMMHLLTGIYPDYLRREPYVPAFMTLPPIKALELDIEINPETPLFCLPAVSSYVGGDITGGVLASGLYAADEIILLIDLGTNGEIVLGNKDFMLTCACSAGPAFEGGEISCGMRASVGAIEKVAINKTTLEPDITTVNNGVPKGICGSGLIDTVAEMFRTGIIDRKGRLDKTKNSPRIRFDEDQIGEYVLAFASEWGAEKDITITEIDLDNFIRAKGAVYSAVATLLNSLDMTFRDIDKTLIAGGIGSNINIINGITIGLFPDLPLEKFKSIGNSSLLGSYLALLSLDARRKVEEIAGKMTYVELSIHPFYMAEFIAACFLPHTDLDRFPSSII